MENYHIQRQLGYRNDSKTYLVFHILNKEKYVLKMHECKDESHANEVFKEAFNLSKVNHPYIGKVIECFVHYDNIKRTFYLIVVTPFYQNGNCYQNLKINWLHKTKIYEPFIKQLVVQVFELLSILDNYGISHMNLKPENVFYDTNKRHILLCDFGYKAIFEDKRRYIRAKPLDYMWTSPLICNTKEPSKIDVWTIGMFSFAFMTTSVMNENEFLQLFQSTEKYNMKKMERIIKDLYSEPFVNFIMQIFDYDNNKRPDVKGVIATPFYQECYKVYCSKFVSRKLSQKITPAMRPVPSSRSPKDVLHYIWTENNNELCVEEALGKFRYMCKHNIIDQLPDDYAKLITDAMETNRINDKICEYACSCLGYLAMYSNNPGDYVFTRPVIQSVVNSLKVHQKNYKLYRYAAAYFIVLSSFCESSILIGKTKGLEILILALSRFMDHVNVTAILLNSIWNLCVEQSNCETAIKNNVRHVIIKVYESLPDSSEVLSNAAACLLAIITSLDISVNSDNIFLVYYLMRSLQTHCNYTTLVRYTLVLLESLTTMNEEHAMQFIECQNDKGNPPGEVIVYYGIDIMKNIYTIYNDNSEIILSICNVIYRVVSFVDLVDAMINIKDLSEFLRKISERYKNSVCLHSCIQGINKKIAGQLKYFESITTM